MKHVKTTDLRAAAALATQATHGAARIAEAVHQSVWSTLGVPGGPPGQTRGLTGFVYRAVHGVTQLVGKGLQAGFFKLEPQLEQLVDAPPETPQREAVLAALNGVLGDRLADEHNPLATPMTLRVDGHALALRPGMPVDGATDRILLLVHGLCMNDLQWKSPPADDASAPKPNDPWRALAAEQGYTPVYLRYNTGRHISDNGRELAALLDPLLAHWPMPVRDLSIVAHSMGGLVTRSALHVAQETCRLWPGRLQSVFMLGAPHHGAPLERAGNWIDLLIGSTPFSAPFAKLTQLRSAGITDLRYGCTVDADWQGRDRFRHLPDQRQPLPLPSGPAWHVIAATTASKRGLLTDRLLGDGLVPLRSALGQHDDPRHCLEIAAQNQHIAYRMNHLALLHNPLVTDLVRHWMVVARNPPSA